MLILPTSAQETNKKSERESFNVSQMEDGSRIEEQISWKQQNGSKSELQKSTSFLSLSVGKNVCHLGAIVQILCLHLGTIRNGLLGFVIGRIVLLHKKFFIILLIEQNLFQYETMYFFSLSTIISTYVIGQSWFTIMTPLHTFKTFFLSFKQFKHTIALFQFSMPLLSRRIGADKRASNYPTNLHLINLDLLSA